MISTRSKAGPPNCPQRPPSLVSAIRPEAVCNLMKGLLGKEVTVRRPSAPRLAPLDNPVTGVYRDDDGRVRAVCSCDITLAASAAAALTLIPPGVASEAIMARVLPDVLQENIREILNVLAQVLNQDSSHHLALREVCVSRELPADVGHISNQQCLDLELMIKGYSGGRLQLCSMTPA